MNLCVTALLLRMYLSVRMIGKLALVALNNIDVVYIDFSKAICAHNEIK